MTSYFKWATIILAFTLLLAACAPLAAPAPTPTGQPVPSATQPQPTRPEPQQPEMVDTPAPTTPAGEIKVPDEVMKVVEADLIARFGSLPADLRVTRFEAVVWSDGSLGCPQPGVFYTQATVPGYSLVLQSGETTYDYHIGSLQAQPVLCEQALPVPPDSTK